ncbi:MAG: putative nucleotide-binding protein containing TIR-like domain protein [Firmicutes bacterium ADurb.Bin099]|nr:MAG: putative nucleotide-binding protein containing TIR-like domain protein [Firmicutes bacterium ADurb.Bin099]
MDLGNEKLRRMIIDDITRCRNSTLEESRKTYEAMIARYSALDPDFQDSLPKMGKVGIPGRPYNYLSDLDAISAKLEMWLFLGEISPRINFDMKSIEQSNKVFIVHGHNKTLETEVARLIESLDLKAIILHEQPSSGQTIIEKIEEYSDVSFAIVLYTFCDVGKAKKDSNDNLRPRARQNVVFEHGYMIARLGRNKVCAIKESGVETPGDIDGVIYIDYDEHNSWKYKIIEELQKAGFDVSKDSITV